MPEKRVHIDQNELRKVINKLRDREHTNKSISQAIGAKIDSYIYGNYNMSRDAFQKLELLYGQEIDHNITKVNHGGNYCEEIGPITKDEELAEIFGVILGDGHLQSYYSKQEDRYNGSYFVEITLNQKEKHLRDRIKQLFEENIGKKPKLYQKEGNAVRLVIHSKQLVRKFEDLGLETGDKKQNQVGVPDWIKENQLYSQRCLRGLIDTDGAIYQDKRENRSYTRIQFKNYSMPLLEDFVDMCSTLDINVVSGGNYQKQVSRHDIEKFIKKIDPLKAKNVEYT